MTRTVLLALAAVLGTLALFLASYGAAVALRGPVRATERVYVPVTRVKRVPGPVRVRVSYVPVVTTTTAPAPRPREAPRPARTRGRKTPKPSACPPPSPEPTVSESAPP
ncbi:MAG TPA: hypothetical protein VIV12_30875 [Streptosporangiaceae bacterium]